MRQQIKQISIKGGRWSPAGGRPNAGRWLLSVMFIMILVWVAGCASSRYMLDKPVNDPIMFTDEQQDSDLSKVEDGGYSGSAGECPT